MEQQQQKKVITLDGFYKEQIDKKLVNDIQYMKQQVENLSLNRLNFNKLNKKQYQEGQILTIQQAKALLGEEEFNKNQQSLISFDVQDIYKDLTSEVASDVIKAISEKVDIEKVNLKWNPPKQNPNSTMAKKSSSIVKYYPYGEVLGLGNHMKGKLLIRNVKTSFINSPAKFGNENQKLQLETVTPTQLEGMRDDYTQYKSLATAKMVIELWDNKKNLQDPQACQQFRLLMLAQHIMARQFMAITKQKNTPTISGFICTRFFDQEEESKEIESTQKDRVTLNMSFAPMGSFDKPIEIREIIGTADSVEFQKFEYKDLPIGVIVDKLQRKTVDLVVSIDSCSFRKQSPTSVLMPKIIINQILIHPQNNDSQNFGKSMSQGLVF